MKKPINKYLKIGVPSMITVGMIFWFSFAFSLEEVGQMLALIRQADLRWAFLSVFLGLLAYVSRAIRWGYLLQAMGYRVSFCRLLSAVGVTYLSNFFIPRSGEFFRCTALYGSDAVPIDRSLGTVVLERLADLILLGVALGWTFALKWEPLYIFSQSILSGDRLSLPLMFFALSLLGLFAVLWMLFRKRLCHSAVCRKVLAFLTELKQGMTSILRMKNKKLFIFHSLLIWVYYFLMTYVMIFAFPGARRFSPSDALFLMSMGALGVLVPASGGIGPYHAAMMGAFVALGSSKELGLSFAALTHLFHTVLGILSGLIGLIVLSLARNKNQSAGDA